MRFFGNADDHRERSTGAGKELGKPDSPAHGEVGGDVGVLSTAFLKARWVEDCDMSTEGTMVEIINGIGVDGASLWARSRSDEISGLYGHYTEEAMAAQVFGAPTCIVGDELFWGQGRLGFVERALAAS